MFLSIGFTVHDSAYHLNHQHKYKDIKDRYTYVFLETGMMNVFSEKKFLTINADSYESSCLLITTHK